MNNLIILIAISIVLQACSSTREDSSINKEEMRRLVYLSQDDLRCFSRFRQQLLTDSAALWKQEIETQPAVSRREWMSTNSYYLTKLDSVKYSMFFSSLKGKLIDDIMINKGSVNFRIKQNTEKHFDTYNNTYSHDIVSADCQCPITKVFNMVDTIFVDSIINRNWRYTSYRVLTGH